MLYFALVLAFFAFFILLKGVTVVRQGYVYTIERFGKFVKTAEPGFHFINPITDSVSRKVNVMEQVIDIPG